MTRRRSKRALTPQPATSRGAPARSPAKNGLSAIRLHRSSASAPRIAGADLLGDVDAHRAPGDAAAAADAARAAELVEPGGELVGHPLAVARPRRRPHAAAVDVGEVEREAGVPASPALGVAPSRSVTSSTVVQKQVGQTIVQLPQVRQRSATSSQRGCSRLRQQQVVDARRCPAAAPSGAAVRSTTVAGGRDGRRRSPARVGQRRPAAPRRARSRPRPGTGGRPSQQLGQAPGRSPPPARGPGAHRDAEAGAAGLAAVDRDDEDAVAARP